jgi:hypothetical protein
MKSKALFVALIIAGSIYGCFYLIGLLVSLTVKLSFIAITLIEKELAKELPEIRYDLHEIEVEDGNKSFTEIPDPWTLPIEDESPICQPLQPQFIKPKLMLLPPARSESSINERLLSSTLEELRDMGKRLKVKGFNRMKRSTLIAKISSIQSEAKRAA